MDSNKSVFIPKKLRIEWKKIFPTITLQPFEDDGTPLSIY